MAQNAEPQDASAWAEIPMASGSAAAAVRSKFMLPPEYSRAAPGGAAITDCSEGLRGRPRTGRMKRRLPARRNDGVDDLAAFVPREKNGKSRGKIKCRL